MELSSQDWEVINRLRMEGCALVVFLPHELLEADPGYVEDRMTEAGWQAIEPT